MKHFAILSTTQWHSLASGEAIEFKPEGRFRTVKLEFIPQSHALVWMSYNSDLSDPVLIASGSEHFTLSVSIDKDAYIWAALQADEHVISLRGSAPDQRLPFIEKPAFTNIEPRTRRNTELDRMMQYVKINEQRREREKSASIEAMQAQIKAMEAKIKPDEVVEPIEPVKAPEPKKEAKKEPVTEPEVKTDAPAEE